MSYSKITQKAASDIAMLINSRDCAEIMEKVKNGEGDYDRAEYYRHKGYAVTIVLAERYGIELPNLSIAQQRLDQNIHPMSLV